MGHTVDFADQRVSDIAANPDSRITGILIGFSKSLSGHFSNQGSGGGLSGRAGNSNHWARSFLQEDLGIV
jgi:hypothetical protein